MSFILDALKKSESERQRQAGPALFEVKVAPPRSRIPLWGVILAALLGVNVVVFGAWLVLRAARPAAPAAAAAAGVAAAQPAAQLAAGSPPLTAPTVAASAASAASAAPPTPAAPTSPQSSAPRDPQLAVLDAPAADGASAEDYEPAVDPGAVRGPPVAGPTAVNNQHDSAHVRTQATGLPTRDAVHSDAVASLPELRLDLHVYDPDPTKRFVLINMHRLHEGDSLPEGVRVNRITEEGAEVDYRGTQFLLPRE